LATKASLAVIAALALGALLAPASGIAGPATEAAKAPPLGRYTCYQYAAYVGYTYSGWFKLTSRSAYKVFNGGKGKYRVSGKTVKFLSGPYKSYGWYGKYRHDSTGNPVIDLIDKSDPTLKQNCSHGK
jgi:hypothetical protein